MAFYLTINTDNAAFGLETDEGGHNEQELGRVLDIVSEQVRQGATAALIRDANGNTVGKWAWETDQ